MALQRLSIEDAATRLGVSVSTLRRRIRAGALTVERSPTPQGYRYAVLLPDPEAAAPPGEDAAPPPPATPGMADLLAQVMSERDWLRQRVEEQEQTIARLTQQAEHYQVLLRGEQDTVRLLTHTTEAPPPDQPGGQMTRQADRRRDQARRRGWQFWRR